MTTDTQYTENPSSQILKTHTWGHRFACAHINPIINKLRRRNEYLSWRVKFMPVIREKTQREIEQEEDFWEEQHCSYADYSYSHHYRD